ncbi:pilus assembly protein [Sulfitobacter sp. S0837]|uniref:TadE/TadG family type IV pilus assembly protein n=1 Tax=Sulfitobacter maritimus TaxID=2741719 RepID=UPI001583AC3E|nr:TadE/TadG family type IV pilus assembly protein [Sulfitobacter maritimus]NUH64231.1 pilus assembly protein [Sulfitobacter maritimus]
MTNKQKLTFFRKSESGSVTIEFVILVPIVLYLFFMALETGLWSAREIMLRRATNMVARDVRLSAGDPPNYEEMKQMICDRSFFSAGCMNSIRIQMQAMPVQQWRNITTSAPCVDREEDFDPANNFIPGQQNDLMLVRVCRLFDPLLPGTGLGRKLPENSDGEYGVRITTAFVTEPQG